MDCKITGYTRIVDDLGKVTIPRCVMSMLEIKPKDALEILVTDDAIIFKKRPNV